MRLIDADKLVDHLKDEIEECKPLDYRSTNVKNIAYGTVLGLKSAIAFIEALATIEAEPVVHGRWEIITDDYGNEMMRCTVCKSEYYDGDNDTVDTLHNYCPNCGASMKGAKT